MILAGKLFRVREGQIMGKHSMPPIHRHPRTVMLGAALASGAIYVALAGAGTAEAKTHHGVDAPGNPFAASQIAAGYLSGSSFTTVRIARAGQGGTTTTTGEVVSAAGRTIVRSSGGLVSSHGGSTTGSPGPAMSANGVSGSRGFRGSGVGAASTTSPTGAAATGGPGSHPRSHR